MRRQFPPAVRRLECNGDRLRALIFSPPARRSDTGFAKVRRTVMGAFSSAAQ